jgi:hypothetical protein
MQSQNFTSTFTVDQISVEQKTECDVITVGGASVVRTPPNRPGRRDPDHGVPSIGGSGARLFTAETTPTRLRQVSVGTIGPAVPVCYELGFI